MYSRLIRAWRGKKAICIAFLLLGMLRVALLCLPFRFVRNVVDQTTTKKTAMKLDTDNYLYEMVWAIQLAGRFLLADKPCLPQALAIQWLLKRRGVHTELHIGVRKDGERAISAHAWVEKEGAVIMGGALSPTQFKRLQTINS